MKNKHKKSVELPVFKFAGCFCCLNGHKRWKFYCGFHLHIRSRPNDAIPLNRRKPWANNKIK